MPEPVFASMRQLLDFAHQAGWVLLAEEERALCVRATVGGRPFDVWVHWATERPTCAVWTEVARVRHEDRIQALILANLVNLQLGILGVVVQADGRVEIRHGLPTEGLSAGLLVELVAAITQTAEQIADRFERLDPVAHPPVDADLLSAEAAPWWAAEE